MRGDLMPWQLKRPSMHGSETGEALRYRADIDGLRCIAVLLVIGYHAFPKAVPGGYIGVDVFFVISGYLITQTLLTDVDRKQFSVFEFYQRRIRRIFPALIIVLLAVLLYGVVALYPVDFERLGRHIVASATFVPNLIYWSE